MEGFSREEKVKIDYSDDDDFQSFLEIHKKSMEGTK